MSLTLERQHVDNEETLLSVKLPNDDYRIGIRLFEVDRRIEVIKTSSSSRQSREDCSVIYFDDYRNNLKQGKAMLKRLANVLGEMPSRWFTYRNFLPVGQRAEVATTADAAPPPFVHHVKGGLTWTFTGALASFDFQRALGNLTLEDVETDPDNPFKTANPAVQGMVTRGKAREMGIFVPEISLPTSDRRSWRLERRRVARQKKAGWIADETQGACSSETLQRSDAGPSETLQWSDAGLSETLQRSEASSYGATETLQRSDMEDLEAMEARELSLPAVETKSAGKRKARNDKPEPESETDAGEGEYLIRKITDYRVDEERGEQYFVFWQNYPDHEASWNDAADTSEAAIRDFRSSTKGAKIVKDYRTSTAGQAALAAHEAAQAAEAASSSPPAVAPKAKGKKGKKGKGRKGKGRK
ncbi:hypothetical protein G7Y79_00072g097510 [Physcia stellaris]|nr:hypothetical protein G7Y79_00072g097510 [Physcia stellaris]